MRWVIVLGLVVGCGASARSHRAPGQPFLARVQLHGNHAIESRDLLDGLALESARGEGGGLDPYELELDTRRIRGAYLKLGYFDVKVTSRTVRDDDAITVVFDIVEGARSTTLVSIQGLPADVPEDRARAVVAIADGDPFDYDKYDEAKLPLEKLLQDAGYAHEKLEATVVADRKRQHAAVRYLFEPGPRAMFGAVTIQGVDAFPDLRRAVEERIAFAEGDVYSASALVRTQRALYDLGRFSTVTVGAAPDMQGDRVAVKIAVTPSTPLELKLGGGVGYDPLNWEARTRVGFLYVPMQFPLWTLSVDGRAGVTLLHQDAYDMNLGEAEPKVRALATAQRIDLIVPNLRADIGVGGDYTTVEAYTSKGPLARLGLGYPIRRWLQARVGWQLQYLVFSKLTSALEMDPDSVRSFGLDEPERLGTFQQTLVADRRDNPGDPHRGWYFDLRVNEGTHAAGGAFEYIQVTPDARAYIPLWSMVLAMRFRFGTITGGVPVTERYFAGGAQSHRGFANRRLSPLLPMLDADGNSIVIGGAALIETGPELRVPIGSLGPFDFGVAAFLDGGDVQNDVNALDLGDLHWAAGGSLTVKISGIKVHFDLGHRLNHHEDTADPLTVFNFGVGDPF